MLVIKQLKNQGLHAHHYGIDYMRAVPKSICKILNIEIPKIGYETTVATKEVFPYKMHLILQNVAGILYLCSPSEKVNKWKELFHVEIVE